MMLSVCAAEGGNGEHCCFGRRSLLLAQSEASGGLLSRNVAFLVQRPSASDHVD